MVSHSSSSHHEGLPLLVHESFTQCYVSTTVMNVSTCHLLLEYLQMFNRRSLKPLHLCVQCVSMMFCVSVRGVGLCLMQCMVLHVR